VKNILNVAAGDSFVMKEYLSKALLEYVMKMDLKLEILEIKQGYP
jgi:hypothetical protein